MLVSPTARRLFALLCLPCVLPACGDASSPDGAEAPVGSVASGAALDAEGAESARARESASGGAFGVGPARGSDGAGTDVESPTGVDEPEAVFDREFLFLATEPSSSAVAAADSLIAVPWLFRARVGSDSVRHSQSAWLSRGGQWEPLAHDAVAAPITRTPWRILPGERVRLMVGPRDRIEALVLRDPPRELTTELGALLAEWDHPGGLSAGLHEAATTFPSGSVEGVALDLSRRWDTTEEDEPGDWIFAYGGTDFQLFIHEMSPSGTGGDPSRYRGWTRLAFRDLPWEEIETSWTELRPFERARRDVPVAWSFQTPSGAVRGELRALSSHLEAEEGAGPILPVRGFFTVTGAVEVEGEVFEVVGIVRHARR